MAIWKRTSREWESVAPPDRAYNPRPETPKSTPRKRKVRSS